jgi:hypothetical protein
MLLQKKTTYRAPTGTFELNAPRMVHAIGMIIAPTHRIVAFAAADWGANRGRRARTLWQIAPERPTNTPIITKTIDPNSPLSEATTKPIAEHPKSQIAASCAIFDQLARDPSVGVSVTFIAGLTMRLSDAGLHQRQTKALYPNHRLPPWLNEDDTRDRSNRLLGFLTAT